jgi:hypothetical protein
MNAPNRTELSQLDRFKPGDHLRVRRPAGYMHHGIYVNDARVIQFGGRISDKRNATIDAVSLAAFERESTAEVVQHGLCSFFWPTLPPAALAEEIIARAEWLLANYSTGRYNLIGNNCEHMANFCAAGGYTESHQVRAGFGVVTAIGAAGLLYISGRQRLSSVPVWWYLGMGVVHLVGTSGVIAYNLHIRKFWRNFGPKWKEYGHGRARR